MRSRVGIFGCTLLCVGLLAACTKQDVNKTTTAEKSEKTVDANAPQSKHSKIKLPENFPKDLPLPENIQLETYNEVLEDNAATLTGLLAGKMKTRMESLHYKLLGADWKANLVMPQGKQTLMHYTKDGRNIIVELNESVGNVVKYNLSYDIPASADKSTENQPKASESKESKSKATAK